jgi:uncharacterized protein with ParB-like and HNH nuclease domain
MQGIDKDVKQVLGTGNNYYIPAYQRAYEWKEELWQTLIRDVLSASTALDNTPEHWLGIMLLSSDDSIRFPGDESFDNYSVIDGQQRLVTLLIWLSALNHHANDMNESINFDIKKICKLSPQKIDQLPLRVIMDGNWLEPRYSNLSDTQIFKAYHYFRFLLWMGNSALLEEQPLKIPKFITPKNNENIIDYWSKFLNTKKGKTLPQREPIAAQLLLRGTLDRLTIYTLIHKPRTDESQAVIFDTLNGHRTPLEPLDHIRNSVFVKFEKEEATSIYDNYWEPAESELRDKKLKKLNPSTNFIYDFVISKGEKKRQGTINKNRGAGHFNYMVRRLKDDQLSDFIKEDLTLAMSTWPVIVRSKNIVKFQEQEFEFSTEIIQLIDSIRELSANPLNPLLLLYFTDFIKGNIDEVILKTNLKLLESYIVRQILSLTPLSPLRSKVMEICSFLEGRTDSITLREALSKYGWISNDLIVKNFEKREVYDQIGPTALGAIFRGIETQLSGSGSNKFKVSKNEYTIEHIYPVKPGKWENDIKNWKSDLKKMAPYLHTLGNLTVVTQEHNSKVGNKPLADKQEFPTILGTSAPLRIHEGWIKSKQWTEKEIQKRTSDLLSYALLRWPEITKQ